MCGIAGVWRKNSPISQADLNDVAAMMRAIVHRGPDDHGSWSNGRLALGHQRLSIIDLSQNGRQPMHHRGGRWGSGLQWRSLQFRSAARRRLRAEGLEFHTATDTEVVLQALHHWGPAKAVPLFNGMFSIAYCDLRTSELWLARDRLGIKPMSVAEYRDRIIFASEDKAILACGGFRRDIDSREITLRLAWQFRDSGSSLFSAIERMPPAGLWKITDAGVEKSCFWHVLDVVDAARIAGDGSSDAEHRSNARGIWSKTASVCTASPTRRLRRPAAAASILGSSPPWRSASGPSLHAYVVDPQLGKQRGRRC